MIVKDLMKLNCLNILTIKNKENDEKNTDRVTPWLSVLKTGIFNQTFIKESIE